MAFKMKGSPYGGKRSGEFDMNPRMSSNYAKSGVNMKDSPVEWAWLANVGKAVGTAAKVGAKAVGTAAKSKESIASTRSQHLAPRMFWLDEYGSIQQLNYGCHGYASNFALSILDRGYRPNMSREEATDLIKNCFEQLRTRYIINSPNPPRIKCIDADGCQLVE